MEDILNWNSVELCLDGLNVVMSLGYQGLQWTKGLYDKATVLTVDVAKELVYNHLSWRSREIEEIARIGIVRKFTSSSV